MLASRRLEAKDRGVEVTAVLDKRQRTEKYSAATFLHNEGMLVYIDAKFAITTNAIMLIDGATIISIHTVRQRR
jgi:hypothetical protein